MTVVILFLVINLLVGLYHGTGVKTVERYAVGDRTFNTASIAATIAATYISGDLFIAYVSETYKEGFFFIAAAFSGVICLLIIGWMFGRPQMHEFFGSLSVAETMGNLYGKKVRVITALSSIALAVGMTALQIKVFSTIFNHFFAFSSTYAVLISSLVVIIYSAFGGIKSVTFTDIIQFLTFGVFVPMFALFLYQAFSSPELISNTLKDNEAFNYRELINYRNPKFFPNFFIFLWCLIPSLNSTIFQRVLMAKNTKQVRYAFTLAAVICFFMLLSICFIGLVIASYAPNIDPNNVLMYAIENCQFLWIKSFALIGIMAMVMSTADSWINTASIIITNDLCKTLGIRLSKELVFTRIAAVIVGVSAILLALQASNLLKLALLSANFYMPIVTVPLLLAVFGFRSTSRVVLIGMFFGAITVISWKTIFTNTDIDSVMPAMLVNLIIMLLSHYLLREPRGYTKKVISVDKQKGQKSINLKDFKERILHFNIIEYCNTHSPIRDIGYIYTGIAILMTICGTIPFDWILYKKHMHLNNVLQGIILLTSTSLIFYNLWSKYFKEKYLALFWHISIFISLGVISNILVLISNYSEISIIVLILSLTVIGVLLRWQEAILTILLGMLIGIFYCYYWVAEDITVFNNQYNLEFKIFIIIMLFIGVITVFIKPLKDEFINETALRKNFEKLYLDLDISYQNAKNVIKDNVELANLLDKKLNSEKSFINLMSKYLKIQQVKCLLKNQDNNLNQLPIVILEENEEVVNIKSCIDSAITFISFAAKKAAISVQVKCTVENINLNIGKAALYQIIFSYISNTFDLIPEGKKMDIKVQSDVDKLLIKINYVGFGLSESELINYTKHKNHINPFLLNWRKLLEVSSYYNFNLDINKNASGGTIIITKNLPNNICRLFDYKERKNNSL